MSTAVLAGHSGGPGGHFTSPHWLFFRIYPGSFEHLEAAVPAFVGPAARMADEAVDPCRWFFLRYMDGRGPHIRLRVCAGERQLARIEQALEAEFLSRLAEVDRRGVPRGAFIGFDQAVYEPEVAKYGGDEGLELSYPVFEASSRLALSIASQGWGRERFAIAAALSLRAVQAVLSGPARRSFLAGYKRYWCGQGFSNSAAIERRVERAALLHGQAVRGRARQVAGSGPLSPAIGLYVAGLERAMTSPARGRVRRTDEHLLFNYVHLMNNRIGVRPWEEAVVAQVLLLGDLRLEAEGEDPQPGPPAMEVGA